MRIVALRSPSAIGWQRYRQIDQWEVGAGGRAEPPRPLEAVATWLVATETPPADDAGKLAEWLAADEKYLRRATTNALHGREAADGDRRGTAGDETPKSPAVARGADRAAAGDATPKTPLLARDAAMEHRTNRARLAPLPGRRRAPIRALT